MMVIESREEVHIFNIMESLENNIIRVLRELGFSDSEAFKLESQFTFRAAVGGNMLIDVRDDPTLLEIALARPHSVGIYMFKYSDQEFKAR